MKNLRQILVAIFVLTFMSACDKDDNGPKETLERATISAKWNVDNSSEYESFEFNESGNYIIIRASKQEEMKNTTKTELLCRTWELISINGEDVAGTEDETTVLFSKAGTYFVTWYDGDSGLAQWKWKDESENTFLYSWEEEPDWEEEAFVEIIELTNSTLQILEVWEDESELYVLEPAVNTKSVKINPGMETTGKISRTGLLKK